MADTDFLKSIGTYIGPIKEEPTSSQTAPDEFLNTIGTYVGPAKEDVSTSAPPPSPAAVAPSPPPERSVPGFEFHRQTEDAPAHYEGPQGEWVLPEDIHKAYDERISPEVERQYRERTDLASPVREFVHSATIGHAPQVEAAAAKALSVLGFLPNRSYQEEKAISRGLLEKYREEYPGRSFASGIAGGVASVAALPELLPTKAVAALEYANPLSYVPRIQQWARMAPSAEEASFNAAKAAEEYWARQAAVKGAGAGAPYGAIYAEGESNAPIASTEWVGDVAKGGGTGMVLGAGLGPAAAGAFRGGRNAYNYIANRPAYIAEKAANTFSAAKITPEDVINQLVPPPTPALENVPQETLAYAIRQHQLGRTTSEISTEIGISANSLSPYFSKNKALIDSPQNMLSAHRLAAGNDYRLAVTPLERQARADVAMQGPSKTGEINPESALKSTLNDQQTRLATHIDTLIGNDAAKAEKVAQDKIDVEARKIYGELDREGIVSRAARELHESNINTINGVIDNSRRNLDRAVAAQQNFERNIEQNKFSRMGLTTEELTQYDENNANHRQFLRDRVADARRRLETSVDSAKEAHANLPPPPSELNVDDVLRKGRQTARQDFGSNTDSWNKYHDAIDQFFETTPVNPAASSLERLESRPDYARPVRNISDFQEARKKLNLTISREKRSLDGDQYLVKRLTEFKNKLNDAAYEFSPKLKEADQKWAEGISSLEILEEAQHAALNLGTKASEQLALFKRLGSEQKKLFQIGFAKAIKDKILNAPEGSKQVLAISESLGKKQVITDILGKADSKKLFDTLERERSLFVSGASALSGSRTAPIAEDLKKYTEIAHGATAVMTGAPHSAIVHGRNLLGYIVRSKAAAERNAFNMSAKPGQAIYNAYEARNAFRNALAKKQMMDEAAQTSALVSQGALRSSLPQAQQ